MDKEKIKKIIENHQHWLKADCVEKWSREHPIKTIKDDFLEKYPNATIGGDGAPEVCCEYLGYPKYSTCGIAGYTACCVDCWNRPLEEVE